MSKFSKKNATTATTNLAGGKAFSMNPEMELTHAVLTTFLEDKYYESGNDRINRIKALVAQNKPQFVANLAIVARKEFNLRSVSHVLVGELAKKHTGDSMVKNTIIEVALRPDDLTEIVAYVGSPLPKQVKRGVRNALLKFNRYQLAKYKGEGKSVSLVDLFNLTHPKAQHATEEQKQAWDDLINGKLASFDTWETEISNSTAEDRGTKWETLVRENKLGYMALIRNLNNLLKSNVSEEALSLAVRKLTDPLEIKKSKQLPFRFVTAYENVNGNRALTDALSIAMDIAVENTPELSGKTLIAVDSSGSMGGGWSGARGTDTPMAKASIFGATLVRANANADLVLYDTSLKEMKVSGRTPVIDITNKIRSEAMGGGTDTGLVFRYIAQTGKHYDRIIIISDNEAWASHTQHEYTSYKKATGQDPFVYAIDIAGYGTTDIKGGKVFHLTGWSGRLLDFIGRIEEGDSLVKYIREYKGKEVELKEEDGEESV